MAPSTRRFQAHLDVVFALFGAAAGSEEEDVVVVPVGLIDDPADEVEAKGLFLDVLGPA